MRAKIPTVMSTTISLAKPRRRWLRFSLRSFFLVVLVIAVSLGWMIHGARQQGIAVAALKEIGCTVSYYNNTDRSPTVLEWLRKLLGEDEYRDVDWVVGSRSQITDAGLVYLRGLTQFRHLRLDDAQVTDAGLVQLQGLTQLQGLSLSGTQVTDAGLLHLRGLTQLQNLNLNGTQVTDAGLLHLRGLTQLQGLNLISTQVTDAGLVHLRGLTQLQYLYLSGTQVTDAGLVHLGGLTQLGYLSLDRTKVSDAGVRRFQKTLPKCRINTGDH